jgi:hypothetical protein
MAMNTAVLLVDSREAFPIRPDFTTRITTRADKTAELVRIECHLTDPAPLFSWNLTPYCRMLQILQIGVSISDKHSAAIFTVEIHSLCFT